MDTPQNRDEWLMADVADGNRAALEPLVRRHATPLLSFLQRMVKDRQRSEDIFQEVFLAVWVKRHQYNFPRPFKPWLYAIALNKCRALFRRASWRTLDVSGVAVPVAAGGTPAETAVATETASLVAHAVTLLPAQQRAVVVLRIWEQMPYESIADVLGCTPATARSHMHHGLGTLRSYLEPRLGST